MTCFYRLPICRGISIVVRRLAIITVVALLPASAQAQWYEDEEPDDFEDRSTINPSKKMPLRAVSRPLTLTRNTYGLIFDAALGQFRPGAPVVAFDIGVGYGIDDNLEAGLILFPFVLSAEEGGLATPKLFTQYRFLDGVLEMAIRGSLDLPVQNPFAAEVQLPVRLHLGEFAAIDSGPLLRARIGSGVEPQALLPVSLCVQVGDHIALTAGAEGGVIDFVRTRVAANGFFRFSYTFGGKHGAFADISALVRTPNIDLQGGAPPDPFVGNYWSVAVVTRWFILKEAEWEKFSL